MNQKPEFFTIMNLTQCHLELKSAEYKGWLKLPRYQDPQSDEYYADIQAITEDLDFLISVIRSVKAIKVKAGE